MAFSTAILYGIIAMFGLGLNAALAKFPVMKIGGVKTIFFRNALTSLLLFLMFLPFIGMTNFSPAYILIAFAIALVGYIPLATFYKAMKVGKMGVVSPVANSSIVFTVLFATVFFGEVLSFAQMSSILLIVAGIVLISLNFRELKNSSLFKISSGIPYALISCLLWGVVFFLLKIPVTVLGPFLTALMLELGSFILAGVNLAISRAHFKLPGKQVMIHIFLVALFGSIGSLFYSMGIASAGVSIVAALAFSNPWIAALYGKIVYRDSLRPLQYIGILLALTGMLMISLF